MALRTSTGAQYARIMGVGGYRPRRVVDNADIVTYIDSSDEWIRTRSGITERRWASPDETIQMMSVSAARTEDVEPGMLLPADSTVGLVRNRRDEIPASAPYGGIVVEWLVEDGDPVAPGQPLLRLHPTVESDEATEVTR